MRIISDKVWLLIALLEFRRWNCRQDRKLVGAASLWHCIHTNTKHKYKHTQSKHKQTVRD